MMPRRFLPEIEMVFRKRMLLINAIQCGLIIQACFCTEVTFAAQVDTSQPRVSRTEIKTAIERAIPYVEERGKWWMEKKQCMSCHRTSFMIWSHVEASRIGIDIDPFKVHDWIEWCHEDLDKAVAEQDRKFPGEKNIARNGSGAAQMLALSKDWKLSKEQSDYHQTIIAALQEAQNQDGSWTPQGQLPLQNRNSLETRHVITMWNALALQVPTEEQSKSKREAMVHAAFLFSTQYDQGETSEWLALRMLVASELTAAGESKQAEAERTLLDRLLQWQHKDGGWGWSKNSTSDALATSQVVYLLLEHRSRRSELNEGVVGRKETIDTALESAIGFLVKSQNAKGFWIANGTKKKASGKPQETSNYWATAWAVIAMSRSMRQ